MSPTTPRCWALLLSGFATTRFRRGSSAGIATVFDIVDIFCSLFEIAFVNLTNVISTYVQVNMSSVGQQSPPICWSCDEKIPIKVVGWDPVLTDDFLLPRS